MKQEELEVLKNVKNFFKDNIGWIITACSIFIGLLSASYTLYFTFCNKLKSIYYYVDFSFYQVSINFYQILLTFFLFFLCFELVDSVMKSGKFFIKKFRKKSVKVTFYNYILASILILCLSFIFYFDWKIGFHFLISLLILYLIISFFLFLIRRNYKFEKKRKIQLFNWKDEITHFIQIFAIMLCIEAICCFFTVTYEYLTKRDYYIIETHEQIEVVVEIYSDYYITKNARIDGNNLIITKDTQSIKSTFDVITNKRIFNTIMYE